MNLLNKVVRITRDLRYEKSIHPSGPPGLRTAEPRRHEWVRGAAVPSWKTRSFPYRRFRANASRVKAAAALYDQNRRPSGCASCGGVGTLHSVLLRTWRARGAPPVPRATIIRRFAPLLPLPSAPNPHPRSLLSPVFLLSLSPVSSSISSSQVLQSPAFSLT